MNRKKSKGKRLLCTSRMLTAVIVLSVFTIGIGILPASAQVASVQRYLPDYVEPNETFTVTLTQYGFVIGVGTVWEVLPEGFVYVADSYTGAGEADWDLATRTLKVQFACEYTIDYEVIASSYDQTAVFLGTYHTFVEGCIEEEWGDVTGDTEVVVEEEGAGDTTPPVVSNPTADPDVIPDDTDNNPLWGESSTLSVTVTDDSGIASVTIDLSAISGSATQSMTNTGGDIWSVTTNASDGTAGWTGTAYEPYQLQVTATDEYGLSNTAVSIPLTVMKNGDVSENGAVTSYDTYHLSMWLLGEPGFELIEEVADVSGNGAVTSYDTYHLSMWLLGEPGFELK